MTLPTKVLRVARISYLNTEPFLLEWPAGPHSLVSATPRRLGEWAAEGYVDAGPLPVVDLWRLEGEFEPLAGFGIAVKRAAQSVFLFSKKPLDQLALTDIGVTDHSSTSVQLLKNILLYRYGFQAHLHLGFRPTDEARLLIGDEALRLRGIGLKGFPYKMDLGQEWFEWKKLPFVFARWAVRRTAPAYLKEELAERLDRSLKLYEEEEERIIHEAAQRLELPTKEVESYMDGFIFRLGETEVRSEMAFRDLVTGKAAGCGC